MDQLQIMSLDDWQDKAQIEVIGAVRKSGKFDLTQNMTLGDAIKLAGQTSANAFPGEGVIIRCIYNKVNRHFDVKMYHFDVMNLLNNGRSALITLEDADRIIIRSASSKNVQISIEGAVQFPGTYVLPAGAKITTLISAAGGLLENADLRAADYRRESVKIQQQKHLQRLFELTRQRLSRTRSHLTKDGQIREGYAGTMEMMGLGQLKNEMVQNQSNGRVVLDFLQDDFPESLDNLLLENQDKLIIPQKMSSVMIIGHVFSPSAFVWRLQLSVEDYLRMSGGYREEAGAEEVYLVMASGEVRAARQIGHSKLMDFIPGPGDSIVVPKQELKRSTMAQTSDYLSLFKQMAEVGILAKGIPGRSDISASIESTQREQSSSLSSYDHLLNKK
ncbi:MAG: SLBB domain-containing protein [Lentisphaeraceae bacterium]|nr:SLBB domain-containing protein [Lentisphaeraceae bacterium]